MMSAVKTSMVTLGWFVIFFLTFIATLAAIAVEEFQLHNRLVGPVLFQIGMLAIMKGLFVVARRPQGNAAPALRDIGLGLVVVVAATLTMPGLGGCFSLTDCR